MKIGKLAEAVLKRAVLRPLGEGSSGRDRRYGADCAVLEEESGMVSVYTVVGAIPGADGAPDMLATAVVNNLAAAGAMPEAMLLHVTLPCGYEESLLREDMRRIAEYARVYKMEVIGGHTEVSDAIRRPLYSASGIGKARRGDCCAEEVLRPGQDIIMTKWIALAASAALADAKEEELKKRYPDSLLASARKYKNMTSVLNEAQIAVRFGRCAMHDLSQGGIFGALWEMAERAGVGLDIDMKKIPIRQETVEICEYFDLNPYCLYSAGALLIGTDQGEALTEVLSESGIAASVIGRATSGCRRIIRNGAETRCLDRPGQDEWYRKFGA